MSTHSQTEINLGYPLHRETAKENIGNLDMLPKQRENRGNLVCSSCKFIDSKGKRYFDISLENL